MNKIDISTEEKKQEVYKVFDSFENKSQIHKYYKISDNTVFYIKTNKIMRVEQKKKN